MIGELMMIAMREKKMSLRRLNILVMVEYCVSCAVSTGIRGLLRKWSCAALRSASDAGCASSMPMDSMASDRARMVSESRVSTSAMSTVCAFRYFAVIGRWESSGSAISSASSLSSAVKGTERSRLGAFGVLPALALTGQTAMGMYPSDLLLRSCTMVS